MEEIKNLLEESLKIPEVDPNWDSQTDIKEIIEKYGIKHIEEDDES